VNHYALFHFSLQKNGRFFQFSVQPGTPWEDIPAVLDEFKQEIAAFEAKAKEAAQNQTPTVLENEPGS
jgi:hypothetical protein